MNKWLENKHLISSTLPIKQKKQGLSFHIISLTLKMYLPTFQKMILDIVYNFTPNTKILQIRGDKYIKLGIFKAIKLNYFYLFLFRCSRQSKVSGTRIHLKLALNFLLWKSLVEIITYSHKFYIDCLNRLSKRVQ